jgi:hypothetical protein
MSIFQPSTAISAFRGPYGITIQHDSRDEIEGAELVPASGGPIFQLSRIQFGLLDGTRYFEPHGGGAARSM